MFPVCPRQTSLYRKLGLQVAAPVVCAVSFPVGYFSTRILDRSAIPVVVIMVIVVAWPASPSERILEGDVVGVRPLRFVHRSYREIRRWIVASCAFDLPSVNT